MGKVYPPMRSALAATSLVLGLALFSGCGADARLRTTETTLEVVRIGTETGWGLMNAAALDAEGRYLDALAATPPSERPSRAEADEALAQLRLDWNGRLAAFQAVRQAHLVALEVYGEVAAGRKPLSALQTALDELLGLYARVQELLTEVRQ